MNMLEPEEIIVARCEDFPTIDNIYQLQCMLSFPEEGENAYTTGYWRTLEEWEYNALKTIHSFGFKLYKKTSEKEANDDINWHNYFEDKGYRFNKKGEICEKVSGIISGPTFYKNSNFGSNDTSVECYKHRLSDVRKIFERNSISAFVLPNGYPIIPAIVPESYCITLSELYRDDTLVYVIGS